MHLCKLSCFNVFRSISCTDSRPASAVISGTLAISYSFVGRYFNLFVKFEFTICVSNHTSLPELVNCRRLGRIMSVMRSILLIITGLRQTDIFLDLYSQ